MTSNASGTSEESSSKRRKEMDVSGFVTVGAIVWTDEGSLVTVSCLLFTEP